ncbi:MAG: magnesium/cobalt transporter CorA [Phycisphaerae bacterium]|nr:magnesium/cobalt transporter CorA [Phycisphaerae bacterium]
MHHMPGSEITHMVADLIRKTKRRPAKRQTSAPRNLHLPPGEIVVSAEEAPPVITVFAYGPDELQERVIHSVSELAGISDRLPVLWVIVDGLGDAKLLRELAAHFGLHPLAMEDVADTTQRAKVEPYGDTTFVVLPMPHIDAKGFWTEQLSMFITPRVIITFQSAHGDTMEQLRQHLRHPRGRLRASNAPYLSYAIADSIIDAYFPPVNRIGDLVEELEDGVLTNPVAAHLLTMSRIRSDLVRLRRAVYPMRDAMTAFASLDRVFDQDTRPYLRDLNDHVSRLLDQIETDRFMAGDLLDIYMTSVNLRVGEITKVLTIIATIFIPLGFIAGVYGMNFEDMPELHWKYGYIYCLTLMGLTAGAFMVYFWRKGWLRNNSVKIIRRNESNFGPGAADLPTHAPGSPGAEHAPEVRPPAPSGPIHPPR